MPRTKPQRPKYVEIYIEQFGEPPWQCIFCGGVIVRYGGSRGRDSGLIHHLDEDHLNDVIENLAPMHRGCHTSLHLLGVPKTEEQKQKLRRPRTSEQKQNMRVAFARPESRALRAAKRREYLVEHPEVIAKLQQDAQTPEARRKRRESVKQSWAKPGAKEERGEQRRGITHKRVTCECGRVTTVGPMMKHLEATGHQLKAEDENSG